MRIITCVVFGLIVAAGSLGAEAASDRNRCDTVLTATGHNIRDARYASTIVKYLRHHVCDGKSTKATWDSSASLGLVIEGLPLEVAGEGNGTFSSARQFCELTVDLKLEDTAWSSFEKTPVASAISAWQACNGLYADDVGIAVDVGRELLQISLQRRRSDIVFEGLTVAGGDLACTAPARGESASGTMTVDATSNVALDDRDWTITCIRQGQMVDGSKVFPALDLGVRTTRGSLTLLLPADVRLSPSHASQVREEVASLREAYLNSCFDSGWVVLRNPGRTHYFEHRFGVRPRMATLWVAENASGEGATVVDAAYIVDAAHTAHQSVGSRLTDVNEKSATIKGGTHPSRFETGESNGGSEIPTPHYRAVLCR